VVNVWFRERAAQLKAAVFGRCAEVYDILLSGQPVWDLFLPLVRILIELLYLLPPLLSPFVILYFSTIKKKKK
jgi:hypothetical protein